MFLLLQTFVTLKDNFIYSVFDVSPDRRYLQMFCMDHNILCNHSFQKGKIYAPVHFD